MNDLWLPFAWRDLRSGLQGFWIFLTCLALGTAAIAIVGSLGAAIDRGLIEQGQPLLGGDFEVALIHREATARNWLPRRQGHRLQGRQPPRHGARHRNDGPGRDQGGRCSLSALWRDQLETKGRLQTRSPCTAPMVSPSIHPALDGSESSSATGSASARRISRYRHHHQGARPYFGRLHRSRG